MFYFTCDRSLTDTTTRKHTESATSARAPSWISSKVIVYMEITSRSPYGSVLAILANIHTLNHGCGVTIWRFSPRRLWPWTLTLTSQKFTTDTEHLSSQILWKSDILYFSRNHSEHNERMNERTNQPTNQPTKPTRMIAMYPGRGANDTIRYDWVQIHGVRYNSWP